MNTQELKELQNDLDICIHGYCGKCKYNIKTAMCTDDLINKCFDIITKLVNEVENGRKNIILESTTNGNNN